MRTVLLWLKSGCLVSGSSVGPPGGPGGPGGAGTRQAIMSDIGLILIDPKAVALFWREVREIISNGQLKSQGLGSAEAVAR